MFALVQEAHGRGCRVGPGFYQLPQSTSPGQFRDFAELRRFLHGLTERDMAEYREAARAYLNSSAFDPFRRRTFAALLGRIVAEDAGSSGGST